MNPRNLTVRQGWRGKNYRRNVRIVDIAEAARAPSWSAEDFVVNLSGEERHSMEADVRERSIPAAAASAVLPLITGSQREGSVLGSFTNAVIIFCQTPAGPRVISLLNQQAAGVPNGVRLSGASDFGARRPGEPVQIGDGNIRIGDLWIRAVRSWGSRVHPITPSVSGLVAIDDAVGNTERGIPSAAIERLDRALAEGGWEPAVDALVGLGRGLTPGGDDVLAGLLTGLHATGQATLARTIGDRALVRITQRTTLLSADLLRLAFLGQACLEALAVLRAIHAGTQESRTVQRLLSIGHTSGADLATGLAMGLRCGMSAARQEVR